MSHESGAVSDAVAPRSRLYQGPFGRIFSDLEPWSPPGVADQDLQQFFLDFANAQMLEQPGALPATIDEKVADPAFKSNIPVGYTYFGQFIDHDITFDPASSLQRRNDPNKLVNFRTPRLDLDCVYGRGVDDQPYLYDNTTAANAKKFLIGTVAGSSLRDLPRNSQGRALIGDMRNDENAIVSQLQLAFLLAHNTLVDRATSQGASSPFTAAQTTLRWLYQWIVWHDFVQRITAADVWSCALQKTTACGGRTVWERGHKDLYDWRDQPYMPVEFSVAGYRFGHSMVRNKYQTNFSVRGLGNFAPIFDNTAGSAGDDLRGFRPLLKPNVIQWDWYLPMGAPGDFPQMSRRIDTKVANALAFLHEGAVGSAMNVLPSRNLLRGVRFELPSGTDVAKKLGLTPLPLVADELDALWFYILKEAASTAGGNKLGPVGSIIVTAVFAGLLAGDPNSWINVQPAWTPDADPLLVAGTDNQDNPPNWDLSAIIRIAGVPVKAADVPT